GIRDFHVTGVQTCALPIFIQEGVTFHNLALAIVDEQHRFGVEQRQALRDKGPSGGEFSPHLLTMSATPIPRSLALSIYGDLDLRSEERRVGEERGSALAPE